MQAHLYRETLNTQSLTTDFLEQQRARTDEAADALMKAVIDNNMQAAFNVLLEKLLYNDSIDTVEFPAPLEHYFDPDNILPPWFDAARAARGQTVFTQYGIEICIVLICKSLPECYACWRGAHVLYETKRLDASAAVKANALGRETTKLPPRLTKRVMETLQFVLNVLAEGGFEPTGKGIVTARKIRLIHAAIRAYTKQHPWNTEKYGEPINQEDMAITLTTFSSSIVDGLRMLGITLTEDETDGYMHCWEVIGHIMGLQYSLIPANYEDSIALHDTILAHQAGSTNENAELTQTCIDFIEYIMPPPFKWLFTGITPLLVRYFVDDRTVNGQKMSEILQIKTPKGFWNTVKYYFVLGLLKLFTWIQQDGFLIGWIVDKLGRRFIQGLVIAHNDYKQVSFDIPPSLTGDWNTTTTTPFLNLFRSRRA